MVSGFRDYRSPVGMANENCRSGDFLLHDIGTGDGIVQNPPEDTDNKLRTVPLWGLGMHPRHMHDLKSLTLEDAIERHSGEAEQEKDHFRPWVRRGSKPFSHS